jgi:hypothetical protein
METIFGWVGIPYEGIASVENDVLLKRESVPR